MSASWQLIIPGLCGPFPKDVALPQSSDVQRLAGVLAQAEAGTAANDYHQQLADTLALPTPLPAAALCLLAESQDLAARHCLHVSPVHLKADMDHAILYDEFALQLSSTQRRQLLEELNGHFAEDGITVHADSAGRWYLIADKDFGIRTCALHQVVGRNVYSHMPAGEHAAQWKAFMNEAQMLLHMSSVNAEREQRGELAVNSLWLWGEGRLPAQPRAMADMLIVSDEVLLQGVARCMQCHYHPLADSGAIAPQQNAVIVDQSLLSASIYGDIERWQQTLHTVMQQTLLPVVQQARAQGMELNILPCDGRGYRLRAGRWRNVIRTLFGRRSARESFLRHDD